MIAVVDYGMGNLRSVQKALEKLGAPCTVTSSPSQITRAEKVVVPGVGAFGDAMKELRKRGLVDVLKEVIQRRKPFLGICLGLQILFPTSEESPRVKGLGIIEGRVKRFHFKTGRMQQEFPVPHIGWNEVKIRSRGRKLFEGISNRSYFYFVHSYFGVPEEEKVTIATTSYGLDFPSAVAQENVWGVQFHPEKSQDDGLRLLANFICFK